MVGARSDAEESPPPGKRGTQSPTHQTPGGKKEWRKEGVEEWRGRGGEGKSGDERLGKGRDEG